MSILERRFPTDITFSILSSPSFPETNVASAYGRSRGLLCRVEEGGGEEEKTRGNIFKYGDDDEKNSWILPLLLMRSRLKNDSLITRTTYFSPTSVEIPFKSKD